MPIDWTAVGTNVAINAGSSLASKLLGGSKSESTPEFDFAGTKKATKDQINAQWKFTAKQAKKHGIHPLVALGGLNPAQGQSVYNTKAEEIASPMGQDLGRIAKMAYTTKAQQEAEQIQLENGRLQNELLRSQIINEKNFQAGDPPTPILNTETSDIKISRESKAAPRHNFIIDADGKVSKVLNTEQVGDNEILMLYDFFINTLPDEMKNAVARDFERETRQSKMTQKKLFKLMRKYKFNPMKALINREHRP